MTCISLRSGFWLSKICDASMPHFHTYPKLHSKAFSGRVKRRQKFEMPLVRFHTLWTIDRIIWGTYICFTKLIKPLDRWLIREWMIGDSIITILSCNRPRTWKSYMPHRDCWCLLTCHLFEYLATYYKPISPNFARLSSLVMMLEICVGTT